MNQRVAKKINKVCKINGLVKKSQARVLKNDYAKLNKEEKTAFLKRLEFQLTVYSGNNEVQN